MYFSGFYMCASFKTRDQKGHFFKVLVYVANNFYIIAHVLVVQKIYVWLRSAELWNPFFSIDDCDRAGLLSPVLRQT